MKKLIIIKNNNIDEINNYIYTILLPYKLIDNNKRVHYLNISDISLHDNKLDDFFKNIECNKYSYINHYKTTIVNLNVKNKDVVNHIILKIFYDIKLSEKDYTFYFYCCDDGIINNDIMGVIKMLSTEIEYI